MASLPTPISVEIFLDPDDRFSTYSLMRPPQSTFWSWTDPRLVATFRLRKSRRCQALAQRNVLDSTTVITSIPTRTIEPSAFSLSIYGQPIAETDGLIDSIRTHGILVPLVVTPTEQAWELISGHRRLACAQLLNLAEVPCEIQSIATDDRDRLVLEYNRQRRKTFSQSMREADAFESILTIEAEKRSRANLRQGINSPDRPNSDGRTDSTVARAIGLGGKDLYRQARAVWKVAQTGDPRASSGVEQLDAGTKTVHAAYKDLRRRNRFTTGFRPTPYDVWSFKHDRAFGIPHPGSIPPGIVAHTLHYFTEPDALVVDPMAGGGTTLDVCLSMGRRCVAYDITPTRPDVKRHDVRSGFPLDCSGCDLVFL